MKFLSPENTAQQTSLLSKDLLQLAAVIPWPEFEEEFAQYCTLGLGRQAKPLRLMVGIATETHRKPE